MTGRQLASVGLLVAAQQLGCDAEDTPRTFASQAPVLATGAESSPVPLRTPQPAVREDLERELAERVNEARRRDVQCGHRGSFAPAPRCENSAELGRAARAHALNMAEHGFFQHLDPQGHDSRERALAQGFRGLVGEDLAWGQPTPEQVVAAWLQSPGHCATLMNPTYTRLGIGYAEGAKSKPLWVLMVGQPLSSGSELASIPPTPDAKLH